MESNKLLGNKRERSEYNDCNITNGCIADKKSNLSKDKDEDNNNLKDSSVLEKYYSKRSLIDRSLLQKPLLKAICFVCSKEISSTIRIILANNKESCIDCLIKLEVKEDYHVVDKLDFSIFNLEWSAKEEFQLINCIEKFGLDNWAEISSGIKSKPKYPCEAHYFNYYLSKLDQIVPSNKKLIIGGVDKIEYDYDQNIRNQEDEEKLRSEIIANIGVIQDLNIKQLDPNIKNNNRSRSLVKNRNRKDQKNISTAEEIIGYWPKREEFDVEYLNEAEIEIADIDFLEEDTPDERELKLNVLHVYNMNLEEREIRKK